MDNNSKPMENAVRNAATVILVRDTHSSPLEVFLMRRHRKQSFMGGAFVFPGGVQEPEDETLSLDYISLDSRIEQSLSRISTNNIFPDIARSLFITAIRETFEESGILFAKKKAKKAVNYPLAHLINGMPIGSSFTMVP